MCKEGCVCVSIVIMTHQDSYKNSGKEQTSYHLGHITVYWLQKQSKNKLLFLLQKIASEPFRGYLFSAQFDSF